MMRSLYFFTFFLSIQYAFTAYVNSTFLETLISTKQVGLIYTSSAIVAILGLFALPRILIKYCNHKILFALSALLLVSLFGITNAQSSGLVIFSLFAYLVVNYLIVFSRDIFAENYTSAESAGKTRGLMLLAINVGWVLAPLVSGIIITEYGFKQIYLIAGVFMLISLFYTAGPIRKLKDVAYNRLPLLETFKKLFLNKDIRKIYLANFMLQFFYSWMVVYMPIYLSQHLHYGWDKIGIIFMIMLIPFVLVQYPLGKIADKIGEKKILIAGFIVTGISTALIIFAPQNYNVITNAVGVVLIAGILFMTRVGAATIEVMTESYFFRKVGTLDADVIGFFRNTYPLAYVIAPLIATVFFLLFPFKYIFLILGIIMILGILNIRGLNNSHNSH